MRACAPKLFAIARDVAENKEKVQTVHQEIGSQHPAGDENFRLSCLLLGILDCLPCWSICELSDCKMRLALWSHQSVLIWFDACDLNMFWVAETQNILPSLNWQCSARMLNMENVYAGASKPEIPHLRASRLRRKNLSVWQQWKSWLRRLTARALSSDIVPPARLLAVCCGPRFNSIGNLRGERFRCQLSFSMLQP